MRKRILVVEDDPSIRRAVVDALTLTGYDVCHTFKVDEAYEIIRYQNLNLVLLDLVLPGADGRSLLQRIRRDGCQVPVIIMTACGVESERVHGLQSGADDYVVKPFSLRELVARVEAVLRRSNGHSATIQAPNSTVSFHFGSIEFDTHQIRFLDGSLETLTERESELLAYLALRADKVVSRDEILRQVWKLKPEGLNTRTIDMHIARLREKLRDRSVPPEVLLTVRSKGYRLNINQTERT